MLFGNVRFETLTVERGKTNAMGERTTDSTHTIQGVVVTNWGNGFGISFRGRQTAKDRDETAPHSAEIYVPRGTDLRNRDRIRRADGQTYRVVGDALWDIDHPLSGTDFGLTIYQVESTNG